MAQPLRFSQIGFAALQLGGPFRHLRLEFDACRTKCCCGMIRGHGEQQLVNLGRAARDLSGTWFTELGRRRLKRPVVDALPRRKAGLFLRLCRAAQGARSGKTGAAR
jgi:hypothetical protein